MVDLARPQASAHRHFALDGLRGVASLMVFFHHTGAALIFPPLIVFGNAGVHIFFVLSDYLLFRPFLHATLSGRPSPVLDCYYKRRFLLIYPPCFIALVAVCVARYVTNKKPADATTILNHVMMIYNYFPGTNICRFNAVFWTPWIEAQYYLFCYSPFSVFGRLCRADARQLSSQLLSFV